MSRDELIEAMARAEATWHYAARFNKAPDDPHVTMNVDGNWNIFAEQISRTLSSMEQFGFACAPAEPTPTARAAALMYCHKVNPGRSEDHIKSTALDAVGAYRAMIEAGRLK